jgi:uncharacterized protein involved in exopolysaccharide biosynthesis
MSDLDDLESLSAQQSYRPNRRAQDGRARNGHGPAQLEHLERKRKKGIRALLFASGNRRAKRPITLAKLGGGA